MAVENGIEKVIPAVISCPNPSSSDCSSGTTLAVFRKQVAQFREDGGFSSGTSTLGLYGDIKYRCLHLTSAPDLQK